MRGRERERERERGRERDQETKRPRNQETKRPRDQETERPRNQETKRPRDQETERPRDRETERPRDRKTTRPSEREPASSRAREPESQRSPKSPKRPWRPDRGGEERLLLRLLQLVREGLALLREPGRRRRGVPALPARPGERCLPARSALSPRPFRRGGCGKRVFRKGAPEDLRRSSLAWDPEASAAQLRNDRPMAHCAYKGEDTSSGGPWQPVGGPRVGVRTSLARRARLEGAGQDRHFNIITCNN